MVDSYHFQFPLLGSRKTWSIIILGISAFQFPLLGSYRVWGYPLESAKDILSIPFIGFPSLLIVYRNPYTIYFQFPLLGSINGEEKEGKGGIFFQFPLLGSWGHGNREYNRFCNFQFPLLGSRKKKVVVVGGWKVNSNFQFPLLGSEVHELHKRNIPRWLSIPFIGFVTIEAIGGVKWNSSFNSLYWVREKKYFANVYVVNGFQFPLLGSYQCS